MNKIKQDNVKGGLRNGVGKGLAVLEWMSGKASRWS